jgi:preprotein translocase SecE subunit
MSLPIASLIGAIYGLAGLAVLFFLLPTAWAEYVSPNFRDKIVDWVLWIPALTAVAFGLVWFGRKLAGESAPKGVHGGVFLMISAVIAIFFLARAVGMWTTELGTTGFMITAAVAIGLVFGAVRFFTGRTGERWMVALEEQGWFSIAQYKRSLGLRARRLTILGILIIGGSGAWSLYTQNVLPANWTLNMPFGWSPLVVMRGADEGVLTIIVLVSLWIGWRAVNMPDFAEFLIATEAEMNKVSWSTRRRLAQDTVVVLLTTLIMTLFLLVVDLFWGWLLSRNTVGVLPARSTGAEKNKVNEAKW